MSTRLDDVLMGKEQNYILPFFWQHGMGETLILEGIEKIQESGIQAFCVEARPHPDFLGEGWWRDMDLILEEACRRNMEVWLLDDAHFPTGYVNGQVNECETARKWYLRHYNVDTAGPLPGASFLVHFEEEDDRFIGAVASKRMGKTSDEIAESVDISDKLLGNRVYWDVPDGYWSVSMIKATRRAEGRDDYMNIIDRNAVRFFLDTVHEAHYRRYARYFGTTFKGFFSDEPELGNGNMSAHVRDTAIGTPNLPLPWCPELEEQLMELWGTEFGVKCLSLWHQNRELSSAARVEFMDLVTRLYQKNFCEQVGLWCSDHGVEYIGHVIEDSGTHTKMGYGTGHYFRALRGQHMSGIDVVLQQIRAGLDDRSFYNIGGEGTYHGRFFHYGLAKLGVSLGHLDPKKKGRTMCEIFGAYGWSEGLKQMKWLTDHMLVRGVNHFVPHAFTMKDFPDPDCPPYFYARGNNPQYPYFGWLMSYMNRISHLINGGKHVPVAAVLYHAEAQWASLDEEQYQPFEDIGMHLMQHQIDYEVFPLEEISQAAVRDGALILGEEACQILIVPRSSYLPEFFLEWCREAAQRGLKVVFIDRMPQGIKYGVNAEIAGENISAGAKTQQPAGSSRPDPTEEANLTIMKEEDLIPYMLENGYYEIRPEAEFPSLRYYHYAQEDQEYYLFFNESVNQTVDTWVHLAADLESGSVRNMWYNAFDNCLEEAECSEGKLRLCLEPGEASVFCLCKEQAAPPKMPERAVFDSSTMVKCQDIGTEGYTLTLYDSFGKKTAGPQQRKHLTDIGTEPDWQRFSGVMEYEMEMPVDLQKDTAYYLDLGSVYETAEIRINGVSAGVRIAPPYRVRVEHLLKDGANQISIRVVNTLVNQQADLFSVTMPVEPSGILGPVCLYKTAEE